MGNQPASAKTQLRGREFEQLVSSTCSKTVFFSGNADNFPNLPKNTEFKNVNVAPTLAPIYRIYHRGKRLFILTGICRTAFNIIVDGQVFQIRNKKPKKLLPGIRVIQLACGSSHCLALDVFGNCWAWSNSNNDLGQIGDNTSIIPFATPRKITKIKHQVVGVYCGWKSSFALTENGSLYAWGSNINGQLALSNATAVMKPKRVKVVSNIEIKKLSCAACHTVALTNFGTLFIWGRVSSSSKFSGESEPEHLPCGTELVDDVVSSANCSFITTANKNLYIIGGFFQEFFYHTVTLIDTLQVKQVWTDCWAESALLQCTDGRVMVLGRNSYDQLGLGHQNIVTEPAELVTLKHANIQYAAFGETTGFIIVAIDFNAYHGLLECSSYFDVQVNFS